MRQFLAPLLLALTAAGPVVAAAHDPPPGISAVVAPLLPSVVRIIIWAPSDAGTPLGPDGVKPDRAEFFGSGFVIDPSGIIVTNKHVVNNAFSVTVHFSDGSSVPGTVLATGGIIDLAVVKVKPPHPLPALAFGDSDKLQIGEPVIAIGNPLGIGLSVSVGVVSALNRDITDSPYGNYIQTDAAINHGNSGGPLVDMQGRVVGVDSSLYTLPGSGSIGLGFAIPSNDTKFIVDRLLQYGEVRAGWAGASLQDIGPDIAAALKLQQHDAAIVAAIDPAGPAAKAGLQEGDIVLKLDDLTAPNSQQLLRAIGVTPIGQTVSLTIWRKGESMTLPLVVAAFPKGDAPPVARQAAAKPDAASAEFGLHLQPVTAELQKKYGLAASQQGLVVSGVDADSPAIEAGITTGDVVLRAMDNPVSTPEQFTEDLARARAILPFVALLIRSGTDQRWVPFRTQP